ncbi:MAG: signal peptidase II [Clostridiales bacterium]|nr:signal peptidase II [Clostridiales bacterium]
MKKYVSLIIIALLAVLDQASKVFALNFLKPVGTAKFLPGILGLRYVENTGAVFGSFSNSTVMLSVITAVIIIVGLVLLVMGKFSNKVYRTCAVLIIAGGIGNLYDRIVRGFVVDFFDFQFMDFAVFNVADIFVTVGSFVLIIYLIVGMIRDGKNKERQSEQA